MEKPLEQQAFFFGGDDPSEDLSQLRQASFSLSRKKHSYDDYTRFEALNSVWQLSLIKQNYRHD